MKGSDIFMRTDMDNFKNIFIKEFESNDLYKEINIEIYLNLKKSSDSSASISFVLSNNNSVFLDTTAYIIERKESVFTLFVNNYTKASIYNRYSPDSTEKSIDYILNYIRKNTKKSLGMA